MPLIDTLRNYLEQLLTTDTELQRKYNPDKMKQCEAFVNDEARKMLKGRNGAIEEAVVYNWARSFFVDEVKIESTEKKPVLSVKKESGHANDKQLNLF